MSNLKFFQNLAQFKFFCQINKPHLKQLYTRKRSLKSSHETDGCVRNIFYLQNHCYYVIIISIK